MILDDYFGIDQIVTLGSHTFLPDEIKRFAAKYDPQPFHLDEDAAERSVFGRLCASGWHTCAMWMRHNLLTPGPIGPEEWDGPGPVPEFGPSPGFTNLKWPKPVYAGETVTFTREAIGHRPLASRPGWRLLSHRAAAFDSTGDKVLEFEGAVLVKVE